MRTQAPKTTGMRALAAMLAFFLLLTSCLVLLPFPALAEEDDTAERHKQKIVTVVYDNSGSMSGEAEVYAHYAIQMLMGLLNPQDKLYITPMSEDGADVNRSNIDSAIFEINLKDANRDAQIKDAMGKEWHEATGGTPLTSVDAAVDYMVRQHGMQPVGATADEDEEKDYWLMIMTDGAFEEFTDGSGKRRTLVNILEENLPKYANFHAVYLGMGGAALDLTKGGPNSTAALDNAANFTPYFAPQVSNLTLAMTSIANQLSGRYTAEAAIYSVTGNTLTLDLSGFDFAMRKVSVLVQDVSAKVTGVTYSGGGCTMTQVCEIVSSNTGIGLKNGFSAVVAADTVFRGGTLTFTFDAEVTAGNVSILLEPALVLVPVLKYEQNGSYLPKPDKYADYSDAHYINNYLSPGTGITVGYEIHEEGDLGGTPIPPEAVFGKGNVKEELTYAGNSYAVGTPFDLVLGNNTLQISVSDKDDGYKMFASVVCAVDAHPDHFRIEPTVVPSATDPSKITVEYRVFYGNVQLTLAELQALETEAAGKNLVAFTLTSQTLASVPTYTLKNKGTSDAVLECSLSLAEYGRFDLALKVVKDKHSFRKETAEINYYPENLTVVPVGNASLSMSANQLVSNTDSFSFALSSEIGGKPTGLAFDNPVLQYSVTCDNPDVVLDVAVNGNVMTVTPTADKDKMDAFGQTAKTFTVTVKVWVPDMPSVTAATSDGSLELLPTQYSVSAEADTAGVNRFNLPGNQSSVWFTLYKDGTPFTEEELQKALSSGEFTVVRTSAPLSPVSHTLTVEEKDGGFAIRCQVTDGHPAPLTFFITSMFTPDGGIGFEASYRNAAPASAELSVAAANIVEYIWRIVLIVIELYILCLLISLSRKFTWYFPKGTAFKLSFKVASGNRILTDHGINFSAAGVKVFSFKTMFGYGVFPRRLVPFLKVKQSTRLGDLEVTAAEIGTPEITLPRAAKLKFTNQQRLTAELAHLEAGTNRSQLKAMLERVFNWAPQGQNGNEISEENVTTAWDVSSPLYSARQDPLTGETTVTLYFFKAQY